MVGSFERISIEEYLSDRGSTSGSVLGWVESEPERYAAWLAGKDDDRQTAATGRGSYLHARLLEPHEVTRRFAFYPNRHETMVPKMIEQIGPRGGKKMVPDPSGAMEPQDADPRSVTKRADRTNPHVRDYVHPGFLRANAGRTIVYPEDQPKVEAMVRAVQRHPEAAALLHPDGLEAEVTGYWTCPETGERMRIRPDGLRPSERVWVELKSYEPRTGDRLDTLDPSAVMRWIRDGWARKSAMVHDGCREITGVNWTGYWIIVEATEHDPRVSVIEDHAESDASLYKLGREGNADLGIVGYIDLVRLAQAMRESRDFRAECTRGVHQWRLPNYVLKTMEIAFGNVAPLVQGARVVNG